MQHYKSTFQVKDTSHKLTLQVNIISQQYNLTLQINIRSQYYN